MLTRRAFIATASAFATASLLPATPVPTAPRPLVPDPRRRLALIDGLRYRILIRAGDTMADGRPYPPDPDLNVYVPRPNGTAYLVTGHQIASEHGPDYSGSLTRLTLDHRHRVLSSRMLAEGMWNNCSGCATPWHTVLTCEEFPREPYELHPGEGYVWEVNIETGQKYRRDAMGRFSHESTAFLNGAVYLTEDAEPGYIFRFLPDRRVDLSSGRLFALDAVRRRWVRILDPYHAHDAAASRGATPFHRLEGLVAADRANILIAETGAGPRSPYGRILRLNTRTSAVTRLMRCNGRDLAMPGNITLGAGGVVYITEDKNGANLGSWGPDRLIRMGRDRSLKPIARAYDAEPTGPAFTPDGKAMFINLSGTTGLTLVVEGLG